MQYEQGLQILATRRPVLQGLWNRRWQDRGDVEKPAGRDCQSNLHLILEVSTKYTAVKESDFLIGYSENFA